MLVAVVTPAPQLNIAPGVVDEAVNVSLVFVHVSVVGVAIPALGAAIFWLIVTDADAVQPLAGLVTVTVLVAGAETV